MDIGRRDLFDVPDDVAYLNTAYMGPAPRRALEAGRAAIDRRATPWKTRAEDFFTDPDRARGLAAQLFGGDADGIAIVPAASYGFATAAKNLAIAAGEEILVLADQFPANVYVWRRLASAAGARVTTVGRRQGET
jgi:selenocysteine lyase/cysteine desulfurase